VSTPTTTETRTAPTRPPKPRHLGRTAGLIAGAGLFVFCVLYVDARWGNLVDAPPLVARYFNLMADGVLSNPFEDPTQGYWQRSLALMIESLHMAWIGTMIGAAISLPLGFLAAENVSPKPVVFGVRQVLNGIRAIPELIWVIVIMMPIFGLGPVAGTMALGINSIGTLGKLTSEVIEGIDPGPVEAARASGARSFQVLRAAVAPQSMPEIVAFWLYRFEINIRAGAILGVVGAGGIGTILSSVLTRRLWGRAGITLMAIILVTVLVDVISSKIRARIIGGPITTAAPEGAPVGAM
jgi:phosphonate transport system permease protein